VLQRVSESFHMPFETLRVYFLLKNDGVYLFFIIKDYCTVDIN